MDIKEALENFGMFADIMNDIGYFTEEEFEQYEKTIHTISPYFNIQEEKSIKYFTCPHCETQLENQKNFSNNIWNLNKFWCHQCGKNYIIKKDKIIEENDLMNTAVALLWIILLIMRIVSALNGGEPTWYDVFLPFLVLFIGNWFKVLDEHC